MSLRINDLSRLSKTNVWGEPTQSGRNFNLEFQVPVFRLLCSTGTDSTSSTSPGGGPYSLSSCLSFLRVRIQTQFLHSPTDVEFLSGVPLLPLVKTQYPLLPLIPFVMTPLSLAAYRTEPAVLLTDLWNLKLETKS